ncbi:MAG: antitoxin [Gammaproteobacteria bacterium]
MMMRKSKLGIDKEEQNILSAFNENALNSVPNIKKEIGRYKSIARAHGNKNRRVSLRMTEWDFLRIQEQALREGLPYQSLLSSIIHKYLTGQLTVMSIERRQ